MNKKIFIIIIVLLSCSTMAKSFNRHELSFNVSGGTSVFLSRQSIGKDHWKGTTTFGLGYYYLFHQNWGIGTGINLAVYNGGISIKNYDRQQTVTNTTTGNVFNFLVSSSNYKETQQAVMITIPLMAQCQYQYWKKTTFYTAFGFKAGIPVSAESRLKGVYTTKGYYPNLNVTYENFPDYGFVKDQPFPDDKISIGMKTNFMASAECGVIWCLFKGSTIYAGIYADYGINNMWNKKNENLVVYQSHSPAHFAYNTAAYSYAQKVKPIAAGVTFRYVFHLVGKKPRA